MRESDPLVTMVTAFRRIALNTKEANRGGHPLVTLSGQT
jgi:hypothetical protein